jgi:hypothetical protein
MSKISAKITIEENTEHGNTKTVLNIIALKISEDMEGRRIILDDVKMIGDEET